MKNDGQKVLIAMPSRYLGDFFHGPAILCIKQKLKRLKDRYRVRRLLGRRKKDEVLQAAQYTYNLYIGDNGYRIADKRDNRSLHFAYGPEEAELWILERYLCEVKNVLDNPRGCWEKKNEKPQ